MENKALLLELRKKPTGPKDETFPEYYQSCIVEAASLFIHRPGALNQLQVKLAPLDQPQVKFDAWKRDPTKFPHFTAFLGFFIYSLTMRNEIKISPSIGTGRLMRSNYVFSWTLT